MRIAIPCRDAISARLSSNYPQYVSALAAPGRGIGCFARLSAARSIASACELTRAFIPSSEGRVNLPQCGAFSSDAMRVMRFSLVLSLVTRPRRRDTASRSTSPTMVPRGEAHGACRGPFFLGGPWRCRGLPRSSNLGSRLCGEECEHRLLEGAVADRLHVVAALDDERPALRESARASSEAEPPTTSSSPTATSTGQRSPAQRLGGDRRARRADAGGERLEIALRLLGEGAERARGLVLHVVDARRLERIGDRPGAGHAAHHVDAEPAEDEARDPLGMGEGEKRGDARAHRVADHVGARDARGGRAGGARPRP